MYLMDSAEGPLPHSPSQPQQSSLLPASRSHGDLSSIVTRHQISRWVTKTSGDLTRRRTENAAVAHWNHPRVRLGYLSSLLQRKRQHHWLPQLFFYNVKRISNLFAFQKPQRWQSGDFVRHRNRPKNQSHAHPPQGLRAHAVNHLTWGTKKKRSHSKTASSSKTQAHSAQDHTLLSTFRELAMEAQPTGSIDDPIFTDQVSISAGVAFVIGAAGASVVLSQAVLRSWRRLSLSQTRGLVLARMHLLVLLFALIVAASVSGSRRFFTDDARALGGILPVIGVLAPFVFLARGPDEIANFVRSPTRTKILDWFLQSPINVILALPGFVCVALCAWGMVITKSWDILALAFAFLVAVLARTDPIQYFSWDGVGVEYQWGRLLPCPTRAPSWRLVIGRVEDSDGSVGVEIDAMETPITDTFNMRGGLFGETLVRCDRALAKSLVARGVLATMPQFYEYVKGVWLHIIAGTEGGSVEDGRHLDEAAASCFILIMSMLKNALSAKRRIGADVWLLLAIFRMRINDIAANYVSASNYHTVPILNRLRILVADIWSISAGRRQGVDFVLDDEAVAQLEDDIEAGGSSIQDDSTGGEENGSLVQNENDIEAVQEDEIMENQGELKSLEGSTDPDAEESTNNEQAIAGNCAYNTSTRYSIAVYQALKFSGRPPRSPQSSQWTDWVLQCFRDLHAAATSVLRRSESSVNEQLSTQLESSFDDWMRPANMAGLRKEMNETFEREAFSGINDNGWVAPMDDMTELLSVSEVALRKVDDEEAFTFMMLSLAVMNISESAHFDGGGVGFESAGIDVCEGELNGRLKAQNVAFKLMIAQLALWTYVGLGETITALLAR